MGRSYVVESVYVTELVRCIQFLKRNLDKMICIEEKNLKSTSLSVTSPDSVHILWSNLMNNRVGPYATSTRRRVGER